jgi:hypothetical protein
MNFRHEYAPENSIRVEEPGKNEEECIKLFTRLEMRPVAGAYQSQPLNDSRRNALGTSHSFIAMSQ